jgi:hypothetical protein
MSAERVDNEEESYSGVAFPCPDSDPTTKMRYLTDGINLYEVIDRRTVQNFGLTRGHISYVIIRDCVSEATATIDELQLAALSEVL